PYLRFQWHLAARQYALEHSRTTKRRWTGYFVSCLTSASSVSEVKLLHLAPLLIDKFRSLMGEFRAQDRNLQLHGFARSSLFVGENGASKTTLPKVIAGLYDPDAECILFDGVDLRAVARDELQQRISFVFQGFGRYEASVCDNIAYGDWQHVLGDGERVRDVA